MTRQIERRLEQLEEIARRGRTRMADAVMQAAFTALNDEDLEAIKPFFERLVRGNTLDEALANCTPEEKAAIERLGAEWEAAALAGVVSALVSAARPLHRRRVAWSSVSG
jgi:hypothetical protein